MKQKDLMGRLLNNSDREPQWALRSILTQTYVTQADSPGAWAYRWPLFSRTEVHEVLEHYSRPGDVSLYRPTRKGAS